MKKRGRPEFERDENKKNTCEIIRSVEPDRLEKRTLQNKYYQLRTFDSITKLEQAGQDVSLFLDREKKKFKKLSLHYELGRIKDNNLREAILRQLIKEMAENPGRTVKEWEKDLRKYRLNLGNGFLNLTYKEE